METIDLYLNKMTFFIGDTNSGKTKKTSDILQLFLSKGLAEAITVLDLAPDPIHGIGGKMKPPQDHRVFYLTDHILAPRLMGKDEHHTEELARKNKTTIEQLFLHVKKQKRTILFINDASLYLQAGDPDLFLETLHTASTQIINAYYGATFGDSRLTRTEKKQMEAFMKQCNRVITCPVFRSIDNNRS